MKKRRRQSGTRKVRVSSNDNKMSAALAANSKGFNPTETFQLISVIDAKLANKNGVFDEEAHEAKRHLLLQRAAEAKRRIDAQTLKNEKASGTNKTAFEHLEDCKYFAR